MARAVVLHRWPWQEHGLLLDLFTEDSGRVRAIAKYARSRRSSLRATLEPFTLIDIELKGRGEVKTLARAESLQHFPLRHIHLYSGLYLNELLQRLLPELTDFPGLFADYIKSLTLLSDIQVIEPVLRQFEYRLLCHLDLDFSFTHDANDGNLITSEQYYRFVAGAGFVPAEAHASAREELGNELRDQVNEEELVDISRVYDQVIHDQVKKPLHESRTQEWLLSGEEIAQLGRFQLADPQVLKQFKHLMRIAYAPLLGAKPLRSRELLLAAVKHK
ncbi:DNA repair protein RecO [Aliidiomarina iranensis]|uniref:DNA repair protein RecO n=1 Tax=Aliidiomarina iranensis TaxID=1434071 RepID=A0A432W0J5_9GAMM|nr:DNA repair protein RecO [Aliidiomarina iranensis]RUO22512.1 DNA repair protein RecO [Aliidiomarina iranensis]